MSALSGRSGGGIVVLGSVNMDLVVSVTRRPAPGETVLGGEYATHPGGKGANQAVAAARLGGRVSFVGRVGNDAFGGELKESLRRAGVDVARLRVSAGSSGVAFIQVDGAGQNSIVVSPGANARVTARDLNGGLKGAAVLLLQLEIPLRSALEAAAAAREAGLAVVLNAAPAVRLTREQLSCVTHLLVNELEAATLLGEPSSAVLREPVGAAGRLTELVPCVVVTLGERGAAFARRGLGGDGGLLEAGAVPAFNVNAVDTTGAGDAFVGAFALEVARGGGRAADLEGAVRFASAAGGVAASRAGAQPSLPSAPEVEALLASGSLRSAP